VQQGQTRHVFQNPSVWIFVWVFCQVLLANVNTESHERTVGWTQTLERHHDAQSIARNFDTLCVRKESCFIRTRIGRVTEARHLYVVRCSVQQGRMWRAVASTVVMGGAGDGVWAWEGRGGREWRRLPNDVYCWTDIIRVVKSRSIRWAEHVARTEEKRIA